MSLTGLNINEFVIPALYILIVFIAIRRANGLSTVLMFISRYFQFGYSDEKMKKLDEHWYNIQLFKFINGINISNIEDAKLIQRHLNSGILNPSMFRFVSGWGDVTAYMSKGRKFTNYFLSALLVLIGFGAYYMQKPLVYEYQKIDFRNFSYYISKEKVIIAEKDSYPDLSMARSAKDCAEVVKIKEVPSDSVLAIACNQLLNQSDLSKNQLSRAIELTTSMKENLTILFYAYCSSGVLLAFTLHRFARVNQKVRELKQRTA